MPQMKKIAATIRTTQASLKLRLSLVKREVELDSGKREGVGVKDDGC
jgi:hypothetical protein